MVNMQSISTVPSKLGAGSSDEEMKRFDTK